MKNILFFFLAALFEIFGCYTFWMYFKTDKTILWLALGLLSLILFAFVLTRVDAEFAGRAFAVYGGIYIVASLIWLYAIENTTPDRWDIVGASMCIIGACTILFSPR